MAVFDLEGQRLVLRIVYDGAAQAGKTTNVRGLGAHFTTRRRSELFEAGEIAGRTLFFDWLRIDAGLAGGFPLRCHVVSVPGQPVLGARRRHLLAEADVVVLVCDSASSALAESREALAVLREVMDARGAPAPLVVQANKQDAPDALPPPALLDALGLAPDVAVAGACAREGIGVIETLVLAIRSGVDRVQRAQAEPIELGAPERPEDVLARLRGLDVSPEALLQLLADVEPTLDADGDEPHLEASAEAAAEREDAGEPASLPARPTHDVPVGLVWPHTGRETLRQVAAERMVLRKELVGRHGAADGSGKSDVIVCRAGAFCLKTSARRRHVDLERARADLLELARAKLRLGDWLLPGTVLAVQEDAGWHVWTVAPWVTTLRRAMGEPDSRADELRLADALARFAEAAIDAFALARRHEVVLDVHPANFAYVDGRVRYIDDDVGVGRDLPAIGHALLRRADEYARFPEALRRFADAAASHAVRRLDRDEQAGLHAAVGDALVRSELAEEVRARLLDALAPPLTRAAPTRSAGRGATTVGARVDDIG
jgi:hypothetical protein